MPLVFAFRAPPAHRPPPCVYYTHTHRHTFLAAPGPLGTARAHHNAPNAAQRPRRQQGPAQRQPTGLDEQDPRRCTQQQGSSQLQPAGLDAPTPRGLEQPRKWGGRPLISSHLCTAGPCCSPNTFATTLPPNSPSTNTPCRTLAFTYPPPTAVATSLSPSPTCTDAPCRAPPAASRYPHPPLCPPCNRRRLRTCPRPDHHLHLRAWGHAERQRPRPTLRRPSCHVCRQPPPIW